MKKPTKYISGIAAYLTGIPLDRIIDGNLPEAEVAKLEQSKDARALRCLNVIRSFLFRRWKEYEYAAKSALVRNEEFCFDSFPKEELRWLVDNGFAFNEFVERPGEMLTRVNKHIESIAPRITPLFPKWVERDYIIKQFIFPKKNNQYNITGEMRKYQSCFKLYPYHLYIFWEPESCGYLYQSDESYLEVLYRQHGTDLTEDVRSHCYDVDDLTRNDIAVFLAEAERCVLVVDCENSDPLKVSSLLRSCERMDVAKVSKVLLFDDAHTTNKWDYVEQLTSVPVEHFETSRITARKSVVDASLIAGVCRCFYTGEADSFLLCSSDSDYLSLIHSVPDARFYILVESDKVGDPSVNTMISEGIPWCRIDDFTSVGESEMKTLMLRGELEKLFPNLIGRDAKDLVHEIFRNAGFSDGDEEEIEEFYRRFVKTLRLVIDGNGIISIVMAE